MLAEKLLRFMESLKKIVKIFILALYML
ncbi:protein of unknown function [Paenibacillus alvei]|uniref:Uncharacterized protein n=1 Tax=Paenibacillus alvei TaxID=44250 RepID=A0A383RA44_PAEAL|nr:protein of unknown function [Paenibacillus alvei]